MNRPSRRMPPKPNRKPGFAAIACLSALCLVLLYGVILKPYPVGAFLLLISSATWVGVAVDRRRRRRLAHARRDSSICDFARSFPRHTDTWVLRSVYEALSNYLAVDGRPLPVWAEDDCMKNLGIDPEDLDAIAQEAASRCRRSMDEVEGNPLFGRVATASDLVRFLEAQPRIVEPLRPANGG